MPIASLEAGPGEAVSTDHRQKRLSRWGNAAVRGPAPAMGKKVQDGKSVRSGQGADDEGRTEANPGTAGSPARTRRPMPRGLRAWFRRKAATNHLAGAGRTPEPRADAGEAVVETARQPQAFPDERCECPFCRLDKAAEFGKCPNCRAVVLPKLETFLGNRDPDRRRIREAVEEYRSRAGSGSSFHVQYWIALGRLNLLQFNDALQHLRTAAALRPGHAGTAELMAALARRPPVVIVEGSLTIRQQLSSALESEGYRVLAAAHGAEALSALRTETPGMFLVDAVSPRIDGYRLCRRIRKTPRLQGVPVVMLTTSVGVTERIRLRMAGAAGCLRKPMDIAAIAREVRKYVADPLTPTPRLETGSSNRS